MQQQQAACSAAPPQPMPPLQQANGANAGSPAAGSAALDVGAAPAPTAAKPGADPAQLHHPCKILLINRKEIGGKDGVDNCS